MRRAERNAKVDDETLRGWPFPSHEGRRVGLSDCYDVPRTLPMSANL